MPSVQLGYVRSSPFSRLPLPNDGDFLIAAFDTQKRKYCLKPLIDYQKGCSKAENASHLAAFSLFFNQLAWSDFRL
jgi:hypothetical protein